MSKPRIRKSLLPGIFPQQRRRVSLTTTVMDDLKDILTDTSCTCEGAYNTIKSYIVYAAKTAGRRSMTLFDVLTDFNTFFILWRDDKAAYWACFLLSSIMLPYIVFWASSHNFEDATRAHTLFNKISAKSCSEKLTRLYYCLVAMPVIGLVLTFVQITIWWTMEIFLGICWQSKHKAYVVAMEKRENVKFIGTDVSTESEDTQRLFRSVPLIPSVNAARYLTIIELFFESIPQCMLQLYIYILGTSSYFTIHDVVLSVTASVLNIIMNGVTITQDAHSVGMNVQDYIVYFMGNRIGSMLGSLVPVNKVLISSKRHVCNLTGFTNVYRLPHITEKLTRLIVDHAPPQNMKTIILPSLNYKIHVSDLEKVLELIIQTRYKRNIHVTTLANTMKDFTKLVVSSDFLEDSKPASDFQRKETCSCVDNCQECLNACQCCSLKLGNFLCGGEKQVTIDEIIHARKKMRCCWCFTVCASQKTHDLERRDSKTEKRNKLKSTILFLWPLIADNSTSNDIQLDVAQTLILYALLGDYPILLAIYNVLNEKFILGNTFCLLVELVHARIAQKTNCAKSGRKRWGGKEEKTTEDSSSYKEIPWEEFDRRTFDYEILCSGTISTIETIA